MTTRPLEPGVNRSKHQNILSPDTGAAPFQVSEIQRPRVCIIPALIMFLGFFVVACIVRYAKGKQDLVFKLWSYISLCYESYNTANPLFSDDAEFKNWNVNGSVSPFHEVALVSNKTLVEGDK